MFQLSRVGIFVLHRLISCSLCDSLFQLSFHPRAEGGVRKENRSVGLKELTAQENKTWCLSLHFCSWKSLKKCLCAEREEMGLRLSKAGRLLTKLAFELPNTFFSGSAVKRCYSLWLRLCKMSLHISNCTSVLLSSKSQY